MNELKGKRTPAGDALDVPRRLNAVVMHLTRALRGHTPELLGPEHQSALTTAVVSGPVRVGDLARSEGVTPPAMTKTVAALERHAFVRRAPDPQDGRAIRVIATLAGKRLVLRGRDTRIIRIQAALSGLDAADRERLEAAINALDRLVTAVADQSDGQTKERRFGTTTPHSSHLGRPSKLPPQLGSADTRALLRLM